MRGYSVPVTNSNRPERMLVITSDDEPIGEIVTSVLQSQGYDCEDVWERKAILRLLRTSKKYDLIVSQVSALETEEKLLRRVLGPAKDIPLVAFAIRPPEQVPKLIYDRCTLLQSPFDNEQLAAVVKAALRRLHRTL